MTGEILVLAGTNGAGKSSVAAVCCLISPSWSSGTTARLRIRHHPRRANVQGSGVSYSQFR